jgi:hypothetical protein
MVSFQGGRIIICERFFYYFSMLVWIFKWYRLLLRLETGFYLVEYDGG